MALTLPYPDMVFVPLDILTAEEQNQLVGNIEFLANQFPLAASNIANGAIGSAQLADEAVTADKIDFTTFKSSWSGETAYGLPVKCQRCGDIVIASIHGFPSETLPTSGTSDEKIPVGYRPTQEEDAVIRSSKSAYGMIGFGYITADGSFGWGLPQTSESSAGITFRVAYVTNDPMPS